MGSPKLTQDASTQQHVVPEDIRRATSGLTLRVSVLAKQRAIYVNNARNRAPARGQNGIAGSEFPEVSKRKVNERGSKNRPE